MSQKIDILPHTLSESNFRLLHAGDDYDIRFSVKDSAEDPIDLTNASVWFTVKEDSVESDAEARIALKGGLATGGSTTEIEILSPETDGIIVVKLRGGSGTPQKDTSDFEGRWLYDLQIKTSTPEVKTITVSYGLIEFLPNLTRTVT